MKADQMVIRQDSVSSELDHIENQQVLTLDLSDVHTDLIRANREVVKTSAYHQSLDTLQSFLDDIPEEPKPLGNAAKATNEKQMTRALMKDISLNENRFELLPTSMNPKASVAEELMVLTAHLLSTFGTGVILTLSMVTANAALGIIGMLGLILNAAFSFTNVCSSEIKTKSWRQRVIHRKAHKQEMRRLVLEAEQIRERRERIRSIRKAKMDAAQKALGPISEDFALANPGQKLEIVSRKGKLAVGIAQDKTYTPVEYMAARALVGKVQRDEQ